MMSMNLVVLAGRLTRDPEMRYTPSGIAMAHFSLAVPRPFTNQAGQREADFIRVQVWRKQAEAVASHLKKGQEAMVRGRLEVRNVDNQDGSRTTYFDVVADDVRFGSLPRGQGGPQAASTDGGQGEWSEDEPDSYGEDDEPVPF